MDLTLRRILQGGLISLFVLVPLAVFHLAYSPTQIKDVLFVGVVSLAALGWLWLSIVEEQRSLVRLSLLTCVLAANLTVWAISLALSPYPGEGWTTLAPRVAGVGLLLLLPALLGERRPICVAIALFLGTVALMSCYGILQYLHVDPFRRTAGLVGHFRVTSATDHPNIFVSVLVAAVPLNVAAFWLLGRATLTRILLGLCLVLSLAAAAMTLSRAGWAGLLAAGLTLGLALLFARRRVGGPAAEPVMGGGVPGGEDGASPASPSGAPGASPAAGTAGARGAPGGRSGAEAAAAAAREGPERRSALWVVFPSLALVAILLVLGLLRGSLDDGEKERLLDLRGATVQKRLLIYEAGLRLAARAPIIGHGLGTFSLHLPGERSPELARFFPRNDYQVEHAVSEPLEVLVESGGVGLFAWLLLVGLLIGRPLRAMSRVRDAGLRALLAGAAAGTLGLVVHGLVEVSLRFQPPLFLFFALPALALAAERAAGASVAPRRSLELRSWPSRLALSAAVGMVFGLAFAIMLSDLVANVYVRSGRRALEAAKFEEAEQSFRRALAAWSGNLPARYRRGYALWRLGHLEEAENEYREVIRRSPYYFDVNHNLARVLLDRRRAGEAIRWAVVATRINPHHVPSHDLHVRLLLKRKELTRAEEMALHIHRVAPHSAGSWLALGRVRLAQRRPNEAARLLQRAIALDPDRKEARHLLAALRR